MSVAVRAPKTSGVLTIGGPAFYTDEARRERVILLSEPFPHLDDDGLTRSYRAVAFVDQNSERYDVQVQTLEPADDATWLIAGRKERHIMGAPPLAPFPMLKAAPVEEVRGDPLDGVEVRSLSEEQRAQLARVDALLSEADELAAIAKGVGARRGKVGDGQRLEARRILVALQGEIAAKAATDGTGRYLAELEVLEKGRGGRLDVANERGGGKRVRVRTRGGLQLAWERGDLDGGRVRGDLLYETGKAYRDAFERSDGLTTPSGGGRAKTTEGRQLGVAQAIEDLATMRGEVRLRVQKHGEEAPPPPKAPVGGKLGPKQRAVLDRVCGLDMTVRATATEIRAGVPAVRRALRGGLTLAATNMQRV